MNWKLEAQIINQYADWEIEETKQGCFDYLEVIMAINTEEDLYSNEKPIWEIMKKELGIECYN